MKKSVPKPKHRKREQPEALAMPERIDASPEEIARAVLATPPRKASGWKFVKRLEASRA